jgi:hypothetical protein
MRRRHRLKKFDDPVVSFNQFSEVLRDILHNIEL